MKIFCIFLLLLTTIIIFYIFAYIFFTNNNENIIKSFEKFETNKIIKNIAIITVIDYEDFESYKETFRTIKCYSIQKKYIFKAITKLSHPDLFINCTQNDFVFRRHCIVAKFAEKYQQTIKYIIFVATDVGIINPVHKFEKYLPVKNEEMKFYEEINKHEISTTSYIFKNSNYSRNFLNFFANYRCVVPKKYNKSDNAALLSIFVTLFGGDNYLNVYKHCMTIWNNGTKLQNNFVFQSCMRWILKKLNENKEYPNYMLFDDRRVVLVKNKSKRRWIRSGSLIDWHFSYNDFFVNEWKIKNFSTVNPIFRKLFNPTDNFCKSPNYLDAWNYRPTAKVPNYVIENAIDKWTSISETYYHFNLSLSELNKVRVLRKQRNF